MRFDAPTNNLFIDNKERAVNSPKRSQTKDEQHALYRFIDSATEGLILFDSKLNILRASSAAFKLCNREIADATASVVDLFPGPEGLELAKRLMDVIDTENPYSSDYILSDSQPEVRHLYIKAFKVDDGLGVILEDITERKRVEGLIIRAKKEWERTFDTMPDLVAIMDDNHRISRLNKAMASRLGVAPAQAIGLVCYKYVHGTEEPPPSCPHFQMRNDKRASVNDLYSEQLGGHFTVSMSPIFDENGLFTGSVHVFRDISEQVKKEKERIRLEAQLLQAEKMASIGQLAAGVAHEINNPIAFVNSNLTALTGYQDDIMALVGEFRKLAADLKEIDIRTSLPASINKHFAKIEELEKEIGIDFITKDIMALIQESKDGIERVKKIVIDLKDFAHPGDDELKTVDINKGIESTLNVVWNELKYKAEIKKNYGEIPLVAGYPQKLNQVFMNLLVNAAQAIETKGEIRISTRAVDGFVEVIISDTGIGIPEKNISKIYDPFFTTKQVGSGTGLGLNMAYSIIKKHNGTIDVASTVGEGTTFTILIPVN